MRIAVVNRSRGLAGGVERYLEQVLPGLATRGVDVGLWHEHEPQPDRPAIALPAGAPTWSVARLGPDGALDELRRWRPDLLYVHAIDDVTLEARLLERTPAVLFAHQYHGTCISGGKTWTFPTPRPCQRVLEPACLAHYYPHRCGGLSPFTMWRDWTRQTARRALLQRYRFIVTHSDHMQAEYVRHGIPPVRVRKIPFPVAMPPHLAEPVPHRGAPSRLVYLGRMEPLKGGAVLLEAFPAIEAALGRPLTLTMAGDGGSRLQWEVTAVHLPLRDSRIRFTGWLDDAGVDALLAAADLLVVPSVWPEPFGLVGPEAGLRGVPAAAFAVGGIPEWLHDGVNGHLAPGERPSAAALGAAIVACLSDPGEHARLSAGAREEARRFDPARHLDALVALFEAALGR
jgi:glycosyltransferase involved in cell wall biosynthesis